MERRDPEPEPAPGLAVGGAGRHDPGADNRAITRAAGPEDGGARLIRLQRELAGEAAAPANVRAGEAKAPAQTTGLVPTWSALSKGSVERPTPLPRKVLTFAPTGADKPAQSYADKPAQSYAGRTPGFVTPAARLPALEVGKVPKMQPMSEPPDDGGTAEPLLDAGDEKQRAQDKAARDLMAAAGGPNAFAAFRSRTKGRLASSTAQREKRVVRLLVRSGGVGGKMNIDLRLTLNDWKAMLMQQEAPVGAPPQPVPDRPGGRDGVADTRI